MESILSKLRQSARHQGLALDVRILRGVLGVFEGRPVLRPTVTLFAHVLGISSRGSSNNDLYLCALWNSRGGPRLLLNLRVAAEGVQEFRGSRG